MKQKTKKTPSKADSPTLPVYESMLQCTASTGIPRGVLQQAKKDGCPAFDSHSRVSLGPLLRWLFKADSDDGENANWPNRLKRAQALKAEAELEEIKGALVPVIAVRECIRRHHTKARAILTQKFETELPAKQDGMPAAQIAVLNRAALDQALLALSKPETFLNDK